VIDTISLTIKHPHFKILDDKIFAPSSKGIFNYPYLEFGRKSYIRCICNPTKKDLATGKYFPRLTLIKALRRSGFEIFLRVEFSAPKLLFGNNFDELEDRDFENICQLLRERLLDMKVSIKELDVIRSAEVSAIHYSKNIVFTDHTIPYEFLRDFGRANIDKRLDVNQTDFRNEGHAFKVRCNDYEVIFYDKRKDLERAKISEFRSIEKGNQSQLSLFDGVTSDKPFEVLRMEIRLGSKKRIRHVFERQGVLLHEGLPFSSLFSKGISKKILRTTLTEFEQSYPKVLLGQMDSLEDFLIDLQINNRHLSYRKLLMFVGLRAVLNEISVREFREITKRFGAGSWYRLNKEMKELSLNKSKTNPFRLLSQRIEDFGSVRLSDYKDRIKITE
jgi:hypothetical protein